MWLFDQSVCKFMRKGQVGDWRNYFSLAQSDFFDALYADKTTDCALDFKFE